MKTLSLLLASLLLPYSTHGFVLQVETRVGSLNRASGPDLVTSKNPQKPLLPTMAVVGTSTTTTTSLFNNADRQSDYQGLGRGKPLLGLVFLVCVWFFSIPVHFRRDVFCVIPECIENRAACNDCVTWDEWKGGIIEYYQNGGGVHFDFSIDPKTKAKWDEQFK